MPSWNLVAHPDIRTCSDAKNLFRFWLEIQRWVRLEQRRHPVSAMYMRCQIWCILRLDATPRHSNLLVGGKIFICRTVEDSEEGPSRPTATVCQCCVYLRQDVMYLETRHDTPAFELVVIGKNFPAWQVWIQRWVQLEQIRLPGSAMCMCDRTLRILRLDMTPRHSNLLWLKILSCWTWIQRRVGFASLWLPVRAMCMCGPIQCIGDPNATPRHSNMPWLKIFCFDSSWRIRGGLDLQDHNTLSLPHACHVRCEVSWDLMRHPDIRTCCEMQNFVLLNKFGSRGGLDLQAFDCLSVPCACAVQYSVLETLMRHPDIRTCRDWKIFVSILLGESEVNWICKPLTACPCHVHEMSDPLCGRPRRDTQTFELAVIENFVLLNLDPEEGWICKPLTACPCHVHVRSNTVYWRP